MLRFDFLLFYGRYIFCRFIIYISGALIDVVLCLYLIVCFFKVCTYQDVLRSIF